MKNIYTKLNKGGLSMVRKTCLLLMLFFVITPLMQVRAAEMTQEDKDDLNAIVAFFRSVNLGFYVDSSYQYVFDKPEGADISDGSRPLYPENNSFSLNAFTVSLEKTPTLEGGNMDLFGFRADILFGQMADNIASAGLGDTSDDIDIYQGYMDVLIPFGNNGIDIKVGKFVTLAGYEVIEAKGDPNITRSWLFGNAIPFTHTGVRASTNLSGFDLTLGLNNGWDNTKDNNKSKTVEAQIAYSYAGDTVTDSWLGVTGYFGKEDDANDSFRKLVTIVGTMTLMEKVTLTGDADFGWENNNADIGGDNAFWWGFAGYVVVDLHPAVSLALRGEYFDDSDGVRLGTPVAVTEFTPTLILKPFKGLIAGNRYMDNMELRLEYRWDHADEDYFVKDGGEAKQNQHGVMAQVLYWIDL